MPFLQLLKNIPLIQSVSVISHISKNSAARLIMRWVNAARTWCTFLPCTSLAWACNIFHKNFDSVFTNETVPNVLFILLPVPTWRLGCMSLKQWDRYAPPLWDCSCRIRITSSLSLARTLRDAARPWPPVPCGRGACGRKRRRVGFRLKLSFRRGFRSRSRSLQPPPFLTPSPTPVISCDVPGSKILFLCLPVYRPSFLLEGKFARDLAHVLLYFR